MSPMPARAGGALWSGLGDVGARRARDSTATSYIFVAESSPTHLLYPTTTLHPPPTMTSIRSAACAINLALILQGAPWALCFAPFAVPRAVPRALPPSLVLCIGAAPGSWAGLTSIWNRATCLLPRLALPRALGLQPALPLKPLMQFHPLSPSPQS
jgi:hypothetical protein